MKSRDLGGFSLVEIVISTVILALTIAGLLNLFISGKKFVLHSRARMSGGELGKYFLDPLQMQVRQDTWNTNCLGTGTCPPQTAGPAQGLERGYNAAYTVTPNAPIANITKVKVEISWREE